MNGKTNNQRPALWERMSFGFGDLAGNSLFGITGAYLIYYYTNVDGISASAVALLMLLARVVDSVVDPLIGYMIDHRILFGGRVRPYLKWFSLPLGFLTFCCFLPLPLGSNGRLAWAYATYLVMGVLFSLVIVPYGLLPNVMTRNREDRLSLATFRMMGATLATFLVGSSILPMVHIFGGGNEKLGYPLAMAVAGAVGGGLALIPFFTCRERHALEANNSPVLILLGSLFRNRAWVIVTLVLSLFYINLTAFYGLSLYYATEVLHRPQYFGGLLISMMGASKVFGVTCSPWLARCVGQKLTIILPYILSAVGLALFAYGPNNAAYLIATFGVICFFQGMTLPVFYAMVADSIDYGTAVTGVRASGMAYSVNSFAGKVAWAIGGSLSAAILAWGGYVPHGATQTQTARDFITFGFLGVPACVALLSVLIIMLYPSEIEITRTLQPEAPVEPQGL
ncbi:MFS transporter [Gluconobacter sphaericus]|uniref:MFS transporter n=1 Tax=Gluconobacter sphaericus NBRC 12467 TaxID=1307951 RepID=A0AA37SHA5_9PROT|nr:glycoside-pentoside-hexuronide (GPH):cation symporter [Gluconobacter sphaericus]MBF0886691.1 hypothetical protein [Gluconobacter sphaericus]MBS1086932.1 MFS transporter [Gluconobacter sphaericus]MBS1098536.1 MFS transporter [Gluconobacter sphaericus]MBS1100880.1 MFS transporter [Gluconobacter sphaericus]QQX90917.1 MFS transporter [Gluconobacter sphaericus]